MDTEIIKRAIVQVTVALFNGGIFMTVTNRKAEAIWIESKSYWQVKVQKDGMRKAFTSSLKGRKGKHEAEAKADEWLEKGTSDMRFPAAWELFLKDQQFRTGTQNYKKNEANGRLHILPVIGNKKLTAITPIHWQSCIDVATKKGLSRRSCKNILGTISAFLHFAKRARMKVASLETGDVTIPNSASPEREKNILQPNDVRTLFTQSTIIKHGEEIQAHYIYAWRLIVLTGLRRGELCGLRNEDIKNGCVSIKRSINGYGEETHGKNDNARRTITLAPIMQQVLKDQAEYLYELGVASQWVFPDEHGERTQPVSLTDRWRTYCKQHGFNSTIHELRHTFISLNKNDLPEELMKAFVGHSTSMDTYGIYGHKINGESAQTASIIESVFQKILE